MTKAKTRKSKIKVTYRKSGLERWWDKQVRDAKRFVAVARWVLLGAVLAWVVMLIAWR